MVDRVGGGATPATLGSKAEKARSRKGEPQVSGKVEGRIESQLRKTLKESNSSEGRLDLLLSGLVDAIFSDRQLNFEDKERILALVKVKLSRHPKFSAILDALEKDLTNCT